MVALPAVLELKNVVEPSVLMIALPALAVFSNCRNPSVLLKVCEAPELLTIPNPVIVRKLKPPKLNEYADAGLLNSIVSMADDAEKVTVVVGDTLKVAMPEGCPGGLGFQLAFVFQLPVAVPLPTQVAS
jgi:hypothetical protein